MAPVVTYCTTDEDASRAASILSQFPVLLVDCEARNLGMPGGALSLLTLSDDKASQTFIIDALAFPPSAIKPHPSLAALFALLENPSTTKVFWDGRCDALELLVTYGITVAGVLDLQLVETVARKRTADQRRDKRIPHDLINGYFNPMKEELLRNPAAYRGIYKLRGLGQIIRLLHLGGGNRGAQKDPEVIKMHEEKGGELWMTSRLSKQLLDYAAHDLELIGLVYAHFMQKSRVRDCLTMLKLQSARYVAMFRTREENAYYSARDLNRFMPFGFIEDGRSTSCFLCPSCKQELPADCFLKNVQVVPGGGNRLQRLSFCRLCNAVAQRNGLVQGHWVDF
ncbi:hypothetical protein OH77DRAFT_1431653 [Trametes cingulata]|nr:hypothetical protein OH77DRAFT_1431653 [Trametes cingulata]